MSTVNYFFGGVDPLVRILVVGIAMYAALVALLRVSGSRTLSSMNAFDFIVTVAIGSAFGRALTASRVALAEAVLAFALLVTLQYAVTWVKRRSSRFGTLITNPPALLYYRGDVVDAEMRRQRVTVDELRSVVRKNRYGSLEDVDAVVLESSGEFSVVGSLEDGSALGGMAEDERRE